MTARRRGFGATGLEICPIVLGTMQFGWTLSGVESMRVLDRYRELGGNVIDTADMYGGDQSVESFQPGWVIERYPWLAEAIVAAGHELALHGHRHIAAHDLTPGEEAEDIQRACAVLDRVLGRSSAGWRGPNYGYSAHTTTLLVAQGIRYDSTLMGHHLPYLTRSGDATLLELPVDWTNDDWPQYAQSFEFEYHMPIKPPAGAMAVYRAEIAAATRLGGLWIGVWHPFLSARPARLDAIEDLVRELRDDDEIWLAPLCEIAAYVQDRIDAGEYRPMIDRE
ncbi:aldo/keto reductase [Nocardia sp. alder85J]|uniref:aldo/keto reductase n=1 Tax=Nocardia sp. alder85J TaxID=2862949 RepID=UPI001CD80DC9|nr:aldo/keto reductase [Nocardia sp. alder85J]MCX4094652.1 polysaccharide deacetylase family protein [Nocardia sp. alder85J]